MRIMLVNPRSSIFSYKYPPLGLLYIGASLKSNGFKEISLIDANACEYSLGQIKERIVDFQPDIVGVTSMAFTHKDALCVIEQVKKVSSGIFTVLGGVYPTNAPARCLDAPCCDCVVIGEGESIFVNLCFAVKNHSPLEDVKGIMFKSQGKIISTPLPSLVEDIDKLGFADYSFINVNNYQVALHHVLFSSAVPGELILPILSSRGCFYKCLFCNNSVWRDQLRRRSVANVIEEISVLKNKYGVKRFHFLDAIFTSDDNWSRLFCQELLDRGLGIKWFCVTRPDLANETTLKLMKKSGCELIFYGVESGSQQVLDRLNKKSSLDISLRNLKATRRQGIISFGNFLIGAPGETDQTAEETLALAREYIDMASFSAPIVFPATGLMDLKVREGGKIFHEWENFTSKNIEEILYLPKGFSYKKIKSLVFKAYCAFYLRPSVIMRLFRKVLFSGHYFYYARNLFIIIRNMTLTLAYKGKQV